MGRGSDGRGRGGGVGGGARRTTGPGRVSDARMSSGAGSARGVRQCGNRHRPVRAGPRLLCPLWTAEPPVPTPPILAETLAVIGSERGEKFDRSFDLVDRLLAEFGEGDLAERLYAAIPIE